MQLTTTNSTPIISAGLLCMHCHTQPAILRARVVGWGADSGLYLCLCPACATLPATVLSQAQLGGDTPSKEDKPCSHS